MKNFLGPWKKSSKVVEGSYILYERLKRSMLKSSFLANHRKIIIIIQLFWGN
jgi:hypothetical protein